MVEKCLDFGAELLGFAVMSRSWMMLRWVFHHDVDMGSECGLGADQISPRFYSCTELALLENRAHY